MSTLACKVVATDELTNCLYSQKKHILKLFFHFKVQFLTEITNIEVKVMIKLSEMRSEGTIEEEAATKRFQIWSCKIELLKLYILQMVNKRSMSSCRESESEKDSKPKQSSSGKTDVRSRQWRNVAAYINVRWGFHPNLFTRKQNLRFLTSNINIFTNNFFFSLKLHFNSVTN